MLEGLRTSVCSKRPPLAVPRLQTDFLPNTPPPTPHLQLLSTHNPWREHKAYSEGCDGEPEHRSGCSRPETARPAQVIRQPIE